MNLNPSKRFLGYFVGVTAVVLIGCASKSPGVLTEMRSRFTFIGLVGVFAVAQALLYAQKEKELSERRPVPLRTHALKLATLGGILHGGIAVFGLFLTGFILRLGETHRSLQIIAGVILVYSVFVVPARALPLVLWRICECRPTKRQQND